VETLVVNDNFPMALDNQPLTINNLYSTMNHSPEVRLDFFNGTERLPQQIAYLK
jgi:hypothetical protein